MIDHVWHPRVHTVHSLPPLGSYLFYYIPSSHAAGEVLPSGSRVGVLSRAAHFIAPLATTFDRILITVVGFLSLSVRRG